MAKKNNLVDVVLYNDYDYKLDDWREAYAEWAEDNEVTISGDNDSELYDWISKQFNMEWEDLLSNIKYSNIAHDDYVVMGDLGLWSGRRDIVPTRFTSLEDAICKCCGSIDMVKITLKKEGYIEVMGVHHDGINYLEIHLLNKLGKNTEGADLTKDCYHKKIKLEYIY